MFISSQTSALEFPVLERQINGHRITYLDSAATSLTPQRVIDAMSEYYCTNRASVHRSVYPLAEEATEHYEGARKKVANFTGAEAKGTVFTRNATEAINLVAYAWGRANVSAGDLVVITEMEHHSNLVPWQILTQEVGAELAYVPVDDNGLLRLDVLDTLLERAPKLVAVTHISNVLATINPVADITQRAHNAGAIVLIPGEAGEAAGKVVALFPQVAAKIVGFSKQTERIGQPIIHHMVMHHDPDIPRRGEQVRQGSLHEGQVIGAGQFIQAEGFLEVTDANAADVIYTRQSQVEVLEIGGTRGESVLRLEFNMFIEQP